MKFSLKTTEILPPPRRTSPRSAFRTPKIFSGISPVFSFALAYAALDVAVPRIAFRSSFATCLPFPRYPLLSIKTDKMPSASPIAVMTILLPSLRESSENNIVSELIVMRISVPSRFRPVPAISPPSSFFTSIAAAMSMLKLPFPSSSSSGKST